MMMMMNGLNGEEDDTEMTFGNADPTKVIMWNGETTGEANGDANGDVSTESCVSDEVFVFTKPEPRRKVEMDGLGSLRMTIHSPGSSASSTSSDSEYLPTYGKSGFMGNTKRTGSTSTIDIMANIVEDLEEVYAKHRTGVVMPDGFLCTPLHVLKKMAEEFDQKIHSEMFIISNPALGNKMVRVEMFVGHYRGKQESFIYLRVCTCFVSGFTCLICVFQVLDSHHDESCPSRWLLWMYWRK
jgi:hypothetical protein